MAQQQPPEPQEEEKDPEHEARQERRRAFSHAAKDGDTKTVVRMLMDGTAELEDHWGEYTALGFAIWKRHPETARALLEWGANVNDISIGMHGMAPLNIAGWSGCHGIIDDLIERGANPFHKSANGWTPREWAERNHHHEAVKALKKAESEYLSWRVKRMKRVVGPRRPQP